MRMLMLGLVVISSATTSAQFATFQRGDLVRVLPPTATSAPQTPILDANAQYHRAGMELRIVAVPGDRIRIDKSAIYVNDAQVTGFSPDFVARVVQAPERAPQIVPEGHYFVMGEQWVNKNIFEYSGQHFGGQLERASR